VKILYLSCHEILEYDELKLFSELGYECYSLGAYTQPGGEDHRKRPALGLPYNPHFIELSLQYDRRKLHPEQLEGIDVVIIMHDPSFIGATGQSHNWHPDLGEGNWPLFKEFIAKGGRVIWRSIGQSIPQVERMLAPWREEGLEIIRYSPAEETIADNVGTDAVIRFYKDPDEFKDWNGSHQQVINFTQSLKERARFAGYNLMMQVFTGLPAKIYGPGNDDLGLMSGGLLSYDAQKQALRDARVFFYHGTYPASYTLSLIEAMMTGTPVVAVGPDHGNALDMFPNQSTYEVPGIIHNGLSGYVSDSVDELRAAVQELLGDYDKAKAISAFGRQTAIDLFGKAKIKAEWKAYLEDRRSE
jgi:hypothetical protein